MPAGNSQTENRIVSQPLDIDVVTPFLRQEQNDRTEQLIEGCATRTGARRSIRCFRNNAP